MSSVRIDFETGTTEEEKDAYYEFVLYRYRKGNSEEDTRIFSDIIDQSKISAIKICDGCNISISDISSSDIMKVGHCNECKINYDLCEKCQEIYTFDKCPNKCLENRDDVIFIGKKYASLLLKLNKYRKTNGIV